MPRLFLFFLIYSFFGYCLEKLFARATHSERQVRKCFLLLPLCPVYGLAMTAVVTLTPYFPGFIPLALMGAAVCTGAEYLVHLFYDRVFHVKFWDYSPLRGNVNSRVCPQFSLVWGILSAVAVRFLHPVVEAAASAIPKTILYLFWVFLAVDCTLTSFVLSETHDTEMLSLTALLRSDSPASSEHPDRRTGGSFH